METCLFCNNEEKNYKPARGVEFVCGTCVQNFLQMSKDQFEVLLAKLTKKKLERRIKAVRMFYGGSKRKKRKIEKKA